jgi:hypothetical protein
MLRRIVCVLGLAAALATASSCTTTPITTVVPSGQVYTETSNGLLYPVNANVFAFAAQSSGAIIATLTAVGPDATQTVGFSLGTYNTATNQCTIVFDNPASLQGAVFNTTASTAGTYCTRIYDNGSVAAAVASGTATAFTYTITVSHP